MASSFLGLGVTLTLHSGQTLRGKVAAIEPDTGRLTIESNAGVRKTLTRDEIKDLQLSGAPVTDAPASTPTPPPTTAQHAPPPASLPPPKAKGKGKSSTDARAVSSSTPPPGAKGKGSKAKATKESAQGLSDDFDFEAGLKSFDKKSVWEEIRASSKSDPAQLLVSHNLRSASPMLNGSGSGAATPRGRQAGSRHPQEKLRNDENVLSPSPEREPVAEASASASAPASASVPTSAPAPSAVAAELEELKARYAVLQALAGIELESLPSSSGDSHYVATVWESVSSAKRGRALLAASKAKGVDPPPASSKGALRFEVAASVSSSNVKALRYLGPRSNGTDPTLIAKLPEHCRASAGQDGEEQQGIGLGVESAGVFVKRLRDAIAPPPAQ